MLKIAHRNGIGHEDTFLLSSWRLPCTNVVPALADSLDGPPYRNIVRSTAPKVRLVHHLDRVFVFAADPTEERP